MTDTLDEYRAVMAALDVLDASTIVSGQLPQSPRLNKLTAETRERVETLRDVVEDMLFADSGGTRLGFESEKPAVEAETSPVPASTPASIREVVLSSVEPTSALAARLGVSPAYVAKTRREAGDRCAFYSGSALTADQRGEIARSPEPTRVMAARHRVSESLVNKIRKGGRPTQTAGLQGHLCAPAEQQK